MSIPVSIHINVVVGRRKFNCEKIGVCDINIDITLGERVKATYFADCDKIEFEFIERPRKYGDIMYVDEDINLPEEAAKALGYKSLTIQRGEYKMDYINSAWGKMTALAKVGDVYENPDQEC